MLYENCGFSHGASYGVLVFSNRRLPPKIFDSFFPKTSKLLEISTKNIQLKDSPDSKLQIYSKCPVKILDIIKVITKTSFSKNAKCLR